MQAGDATDNQLNVHHWLIKGVHLISFLRVLIPQFNRRRWKTVAKDPLSLIPQISSGKMSINRCLKSVYIYLIDFSWHTLVSRNRAITIEKKKDSSAGQNFLQGVCDSLFGWENVGIIENFYYWYVIITFAPTKDLRKVHKRFNLEGENKDLLSIATFLSSSSWCSV